MSSIKRVKSSPDLATFYADWLSWVDSGAIPWMSRYNFSREHGLCSSLVNWCSSKEKEVDWLLHEMSEQFKDMWLNSQFPFGKEDFLDRVIPSRMHDDPKRLEWVQRRLEDYIYFSELDIAQMKR